LGFDVHRLLDIPHRYIGGLLKSFDRHPKSIEISQKSWMHLNDCYKTRICLHYPGQVLAAAAVHMALIKLSLPLPATPWWILMEANI
jgi:hypothetical protein